MNSSVATAKQLLLITLLFFSSCSKEQKEKTPTTTPLSPITLTDEVGEWNLGFSSPIIKKNSQYPLIVYLHGGIGTSRTNKGDSAFTMFSFIQDEYPTFIASPSGNRSAPWWSKTGMQRIFSSVEIMSKNFPIDKNKVYLAGVSDGATALFAMAMQENHPFAGFIGASAYPLLFRNQITSVQLQQTPFQMYISGNDRLYPADKVEQFYKKLQSENVPLNYKLYKNAEHGFEFRHEEKANCIHFLNSYFLN